MAVTCALQIYLYALNVISNVSWGRNMTGRLVVAFAPTVWSGREPFPLGRTGDHRVRARHAALTTAVAGLAVPRASIAKP